MHRITLLLLFFGLGLTAFAQKRITGSGQPRSEEREVAAFDAISASSAMKVRVRYGQPHKVTVRADDNILNKVETDVSDGRLRLRLAHGYNYRNTKVEIEVTTPELSELRLSGAVGGTVTGFEDLDELEIDMDGACSVKLAGKARNLRADCTGASTLSARDFTAQDCYLRVSGASSVNIGVKNSITGKVDGASSVRYYGSPKEVDVSSSGASRVSGRRS